MQFVGAALITELCDHNTVKLPTSFITCAPKVQWVDQYICINKQAHKKTALVLPNDDSYSSRSHIQYRILDDIIWCWRLDRIVIW